MAVSGEHTASGAPARGERVAAALDRRPPLGMAGKEFLRKAFPDHWQRQRIQVARAGPGEAGDTDGS
ncbi:hypothetical protein RKE30_19530 [Streptomyces sp. Li-HN-5-11]|uniref:hypothetical protein n=1 Tax=Streptomyces sp. Li-HN-5-11 TaxID=3075432 RepID=UPI0028A9403F|nr:hypothetical protein [Streptomyces sp. Li-HN-5-11]WNM32447.1 hypothetical protein RKE30_19530 [Streptomyces sp. Li-HN-5-11]WOP38798.1 hypothetical protein RKE32_36095 [Streptomyces sp. Li-HN-5-13]